jgi:hypothetical protein
MISSGIARCLLPYRTDQSSLSPAKSSRLCRTTIHEALSGTGAWPRRTAPAALASNIAEQLGLNHNRMSAYSSLDQTGRKHSTDHRRSWGSGCANLGRMRRSHPLRSVQLASIAQGARTSTQATAPSRSCVRQGWVDVGGRVSDSGPNGARQNEDRAAITFRRNV